MINDSCLPELVAEYNLRIKPKADEEYRHFQNKSSLDEAIKYATYAIKANGKRHPHQYRIKVQAMEAVRIRLMERRQELLASEEFEKPHIIVSECAVSGFGILCIYDTAVRLGAYLSSIKPQSIKPQHVYLHAGTRVGAAALGLDVSRKFICLHELPKELQQMQADDIENFLCIYKDELRTGQPRSRSKCLSRQTRRAC